eukprot:COSAG03_NODE_198_length_10790_cov_17.850996_5_plen_330_part_00
MIFPPTSSHCLKQTILVSPHAGEHPKLAVWLRQEASAERRRASELLGLTPDADLEQVRSAYRAKARHCHPDKQNSQRNAAVGRLPHARADQAGGNDGTTTSGADIEADQISWHQLQQAYEILSQQASTGLHSRRDVPANEIRAATGSQRNAAHDLRLMLRMVADGGDGADDEDGATASLVTFNSEDVGQHSQAKRHRGGESGKNCVSEQQQQQQQRQGDEGDHDAARESEGWSEQSLFKARLAAVLLEYHDVGIPLANLPKKYRQVWGVELPPAQAFRRRKMVQVLRNMPDIVRVEQTHTNHTILHCVKTRDDLKLAIDDARSRNAESN